MTHVNIKLSSNEIEHIILVAKQASEIIMEYYNSFMPEAERKKDKSPVTVADKCSSDFIIEALSGIRAEIPVVSEESEEEANIEIIKRNKAFWLIDPIDGTWSFIRKRGEFTVNIALIEDGKAVWGLIANPQDGTIYYIDTYGQCRKRYKEKDCSINGRGEERDDMDFLVSHQNLEQQVQDYINKYKVRTITPIPSSLKFALMAEGKGDIYPRFKRTCIWDTAAGHALLLSVGGEIYNLQGQPLTYDAPTLENPSFVAVVKREFALF